MKNLKLDCLMKIRNKSYRGTNLIFFNNYNIGFYEDVSGFSDITNALINYEK